MKIMVFVLLLLVVTSPAMAQRVKVSKVTSDELIHFANNFTSVSEQRTDRFLIRIIKVATGISPYAKDTDEVDHFLYVATAEYGEAESAAQRLYKIGPFFNPSAFTFGNAPALNQNFLMFTYLEKEKKVGYIYLYKDRIEFSETKPKFPK